MRCNTGSEERCKILNIFSDSHVACICVCIHVCIYVYTFSNIYIRAGAEGWERWRRGKERGGGGGRVCT